MIALGCGSDDVAPRLDAPPIDAPAPDALRGPMLEAGGTATPLGAFYSFFLEPLDQPDAGTTVNLVVTLIDPSFDCVGPAHAGVDIISFQFGTWSVGARSQLVLARNGPHLGGATGGSGEMKLSVVDDRFVGERDGGPDVNPGGRVEGQVDYAFDGGIAVRGPFVATYCPQLDFVVPP